MVEKKLLLKGALASFFSSAFFSLRVLNSALNVNLMKQRRSIRFPVLLLCVALGLIVLCCAMEILMRFLSTLRLM